MNFKSFLFSIVSTFVVVECYCQKVELTEVRGNIFQSGHCSEVPTVSQNGDDITLKSDTILAGVQVVIKNNYGTIIHCSNLDITQDETTITVPDDDSSQKATIDIYYREVHLFGFF